MTATVTRKSTNPQRQTRPLTARRPPADVDMDALMREIQARKKRVRALLQAASFLLENAASNRDLASE